MVLVIQSILCVHAELKFETTEHLLLCCQFYSPQRLELFENLEKVDAQFLSLSAKNQVLILLYVSQANNSESLNQEVLKSNILHLRQLLVLMDH